MQFAHLDTRRRGGISAYVVWLQVGMEEHALVGKDAQQRSESMVTPTQTELTNTEKRAGTLTSWDQIQAPGTYVECKSGHCFRVPEDALKGGRSPVIEIISRERPEFIQISDDPYVPLTKARMVAADLDVNVNF